MSGFLLNSNNKLQFQGINSLQDLINNYSVDGTGDISDLNFISVIAIGYKTKFAKYLHFISFKPLK